MYPTFEVYGIPVYTFWISLTICFFLFIWMLKKLCGRFGINDTFFFNRLLWYFLSVILFSRIFYIIGHWNEFAFMESAKHFFMINNYQLSLIGAFFGYFLVLFGSIIYYNLRSAKYIDASVLSFLFSAVVWYVWAFLWGQIIGKDTNFWIEIMYSTSYSQVPIFPLALIYALCFFLLFCVLYMLSVFIHIRGILWYSGLVAIGAIFLIFEYFNVRQDFFQTNFSYISLSLTQLWSIGLIIFGVCGLWRIYKTPVIPEVL